MTTIYFLRHGDVYNPKHILYGRLPGFPLSDKGKSQISQIAKIFENDSIEYIFTSPLERARQTAEIIGAKLHLKPVISMLITEVKLYCEGVSIEEYHDRIQFELYSEKNIKKGQEDIVSVESRMKKFVNFIIKKHSGKKILVVSHGDPIMILKARLSSVAFTWSYKKNNYLPTGKYFTLIIKNGIYSWK